MALDRRSASYVRASMRARGAVRRLPDGGYSLGVAHESARLYRRDMRRPWTAVRVLFHSHRWDAVEIDGDAGWKCRVCARSCWNASTSSASTILRPLSSRRISPFAFFGYGAARAPKNVLELGECLGGLTGSGPLGPPASRPMPKAKPTEE